jgi:hypothetical protein
MSLCHYDHGSFRSFVTYCLLVPFFALMRFLSVCSISLRGAPSNGEQPTRYVTYQYKLHINISQEYAKKQEDKKHSRTKKETHNKSWKGSSNIHHFRGLLHGAYVISIILSNGREPGQRSRYSDWLRAGRPRRPSSSCGRSEEFSLHDVQTGSDVHPASYPMGTEAGVWS